MTPKLIAVAGPLEGRTFELDDDALTLGRHASNRVQVRDTAVSRHHATIEPDGDAFQLRDLDSRYGTFVNGVPVKVRRLASGDRVAFCNSMFLFLSVDLETDDRAAPPAVAVPAMVGESAAMRQVNELIERAAESEAAVLIRGERGTGKEIAARAVHGAGSRCAGPFVRVNCAVSAKTLLARKLFGHQGGAPSGTVAGQQGKVEQATGGSLFLDGVDALPPTLQTKLLRLFQTREVVRDDGTRPVDVRIMAATHRDLEAAIRSGSLQEDLYHHLNAIPLHLPPLRDRCDDVLLLARFFAAGRSADCEGPGVHFSPAACRLLKRYRWPGNVRELRNAIEHALLHSPDDMIFPEDLPAALHEGDTAGEAGSPYLDALRDTKRRLIVKAMKEASDNYTAAAKALGLQPRSLHRLIRNLGLEAVLKRA